MFDVYNVYMTYTSKVEKITGFSLDFGYVLYQTIRVKATEKREKERGD